MNMKSYAGVVAAIVLVGTPLVASADSSSTPSQIQTIMSQIQALQLQLKNLLMQNASSSTPGMGAG